MTCCARSENLEQVHTARQTRFNVRRRGRDALPRDPALHVHEAENSRIGSLPAVLLDNVY